VNENSQALLELTEDGMDGMEGKHLTFRVEQGRYGIGIGYVTEIIGLQDITPVPHNHPHVKGIVNLRGTIVPVVDMRLRFGLPESAYTDRTCIVVLSKDDMSIGLVVDEVLEVAAIGEESTKPPPQHGGTRKNHFVKGIGVTADGVKQLLDINRIFELEEAQEAAGTG